jgi:DTW domain-containing protein YfiP
LLPAPVPLRFVVLRHPAERRRTINTARLVPLALADAELIDGTSFTADQLAQLAQGPAYVLYPRSDALLPSDLVLTPRPTLFVVDGTWSQASGVIARSPALRELPAVALHPELPSSYRIRRQPRSGCLCTAEAVMSLLEQLGCHDSAARLREPFERLVQFQLEHQAAGIRRT